MKRCNGLGAAAPQKSMREPGASQKAAAGACGLSCRALKLDQRPLHQAVSRQPSAVSRLKRAPFSKPISPQTEATRRPSPSVRFPRRAGRPDFPLRPVGRRGRVDPALHPGCKNKTKGPQQLFHRSNISVFFFLIFT